ncbi:MAG: hypothetical protein QNJ41_11940 [Xenococcaceae cyanobacterium MO_188.B32]|nr:hypothetical protein [Xenococcaceae cyanobacterium MO_188.B32]
MKNPNPQLNYTLDIDTPVLQIPEIETKFGIQVYSNSLLILLEDINQVRIVQQLHFWLTQKHGVVLDGVRWIWKPIREWIEESLPDLSSWVLRGAIASLVEKGILIREQIYQKHHGHNYSPSNRTYYYSIDYEKLQQLICQKLQQLGLSKTAKTDLSKTAKTDLLETATTRFVDCHKTRQNQLQYKQTNIYKNASTDVLEVEEEERPWRGFLAKGTREESLQSLSPQSSNKNNSSPANKADPEDKSSVTEIQDNTERRTTDEVESRKYEVRNAPPHAALSSTQGRSGVGSEDEAALPLATEGSDGKLSTSYSLLSTSRKYDPALGIVAPSSRREKIQDWTWQWLPDGAWAIDGKLDSAFHTWLAQKWQTEHGGDIYKHKANVLRHFKKDPANIPIYWLSYQEETKHRYDNAATRMANGVAIKPEEQKLLVARSRAITEQLPEEINPVSKPVRLISHDGNGALIKGHDGNGHDGNSHDGSGALINGHDGNGALINGHDGNGHDGNGALINGHDGNSHDDNDALINGDTCNAPEGAEAAEAYKLYQPEKIDRPVDKKFLFEKLRNLSTKFSFPEAAKRKPHKEKTDFETLSIAQINELIASDPILAKGWLPQLKKSARVEVVLNDAGELLYVEEPF